MNDPNTEKIIFAGARELPPEDRAAYLDQACGDNVPLRRRIEALLNASEQSGAFLEVSAAPTLRRTPAASIPLAEKPGDKVGRYKLLQQIGEGGCGVVYMAEQEEPVRRRVALKIIKLGMDTKNVIARFEAERQALAMMDHPNIAKVFDAGATETGRPYFVMELVRGMKITDYCDEAKLSIRARLDLFTQVCHAIQHAHQKGIIHRDIKPSNILVTVNDGVAVPKVIDFGIAKATGGQQLTDKTIFTAFEQFIGTPAYMSPEQAVLTSLDIDTRSDIYALGVLLYELLTGKTPFDAGDLLAAGLDELRRTIRETEPARPSMRLSTMPDNELSTTAQRRGLDAPKLVTELRGDLDWIVMKCVEKDRARRYETANGLAMDIQRHLDNEPVVARPPNNFYRFQKMVRRNKLAFAAGAAVALAILVGITVSVWQAVRATRAQHLANAERIQAVSEKQRADNETTVAKATLDFLQNDLLGQAGSRAQADKGFEPDPNLTIRQALDRASEHIGNRFKDQPLAEASIRDAIGQAYCELGANELGVPQLQRAVTLLKAKLGPDHPDTLASMNNLASAYERADRLNEALPLFEETLKLRKAKLGPNHPDTLRSMNYLGVAYDEAGRSKEALTLLEESLKLQKAKFGPDDPDTLDSMNFLAMAYQQAGRLQEALPLFEATLKLRQSKLGPKHPDTLASMNQLGVAYRAAGRLKEALPLWEETLRIRKTRLGPDHPYTLTSMNNLAVGYQEAGRLQEALPLLEELLKLQKNKLGPEHPDTLASMNHLGVAYKDAGRLHEALPLFEETLKIRKAKLGPEHRDTVQSLNNLAVAYQAAGRSADADRVFSDVLTPAFMSQSKSSGVLQARGEFHASFGRWEEAAADLSHALDLRPDHVWTWHCLAAVLVQEGQVEAYRNHCAKSIERFGNTTNPVTAERIAKDSLILPASGADLDTVARMARIALNSTTNLSDPAWCELVQGLADYRQGRFATAADWAEKVLDKLGANSERDVQAYMVQAMAYQRLNQSDKARAALATGKELARTKLPKVEGGGLGGYWLDWVTAQALLREAAALIEGQFPAVKDAGK